MPILFKFTHTHAYVFMETENHLEGNAGVDNGTMRWEQTRGGFHFGVLFEFVETGMDSLSD